MYTKLKMLIQRNIELFLTLDNFCNERCMLIFNKRISVYFVSLCFEGENTPIKWLIFDDRKLNSYKHKRHRR